jgi:uncharacterized protein
MMNQKLALVMSPTRQSVHVDERESGRQSTRSFGLRKVLSVAILGALATLAGCGKATPIKEGGANAKEGYQAVDDLYIVDCALPGQVRKLGKVSYLTPKRGIRTTAVDCRIRGGEYVDYDRADYRSALNVWMPQAQAGDAEAQNYVGEIFEKGLGQEPDYQSAITWYEKAANQNYSRAQINLGYMYEKGLGVAPNVTIALNWYRRASGITDDQLVLNSEAQKAVEETKAKLSAQLASSKVQTDYLQKQLATMQGELKKQTQIAQQNPTDAAKPQGDFATQEIAALTELYERAVAERKGLEEQLNSMAIAYRSADAQLLTPKSLDSAENRVVKDINFGRYFALIIGNQDYMFLDDLRSPLNDGQQLKTVLEEKYGFSALLIPDATEKNILGTINDFYDQIGENDNLLIYYAGHGNLSRSDPSRAERGYWLPVDAKQDSITNWINNSVISDHLDRSKARSVLVISDSCYAGYLGSEKSPFLFGVSSGEESEKAIKSGLSRRARVVISSGGIQPVLDGSDTRHSVFAGALLEALTANKGALRDTNLFAQLSVNVRKRSEFADTDQTPEMKPVREAGHEGGAFYFVPVN